MLKWFQYIDDKYIRPIFVYKYNKRKRRMYNIEIGDVLREYKMIEEELDAASSDDEEDLSIMQPSRLAIDRNRTINFRQRNYSVKGDGLLNQYIVNKTMKFNREMMRNTSLKLPSQQFQSPTQQRQMLGTMSDSDNSMNLKQATRKPGMSIRITDKTVKFDMVVEEDNDEKTSDNDDTQEKENGINTSGLIDSDQVPREDIPVQSTLTA